MSVQYPLQNVQTYFLKSQPGEKVKLKTELNSIKWGKAITAVEVTVYM